MLIPRQEDTAVVNECFVLERLAGQRPNTAAVLLKRRAAWIHRGTVCVPGKPERPAGQRR